MKNARCMRGLPFVVLAGLFLFCELSVPANAQIQNIFVTVDENCHGTIIGFAGTVPLGCSFTTDPGPGGLMGVMTYNLLNPPQLVAGDVVLRESANVNSDVIRFNASAGGGSLFFYSDLDGGADSLADIGLPGALNTNVVFFNEVSLGALGSGLIYTPTAGQPGFVAGAAAPVQYTFISDTAAPEPGSFTLVAAASLMCLWRRNRNRVGPLRS